MPLDLGKMVQAIIVQHPRHVFELWGNGLSHNRPAFRTSAFGLMQMVQVIIVHYLGRVLLYLS